MAPRVLIFGTGSLGIVYAWVLSRVIPESNITAVCRSNYDEALQNGFELNSTIWGSGLRVRPQVVRTVAEALTLSQEPFDYILVTAKTLPVSPSIAVLIWPAIAPCRTAVVLVQNGIGIEDEYARAYTSDNVPILSTVAFLPATRTAPTVVSHDVLEHLHVGTYPATRVPTAHKRAAQAFVKLLVSAGAKATLHDDIQAQRWRKIIINGSWNPICALTKLREGQLLATGCGRVGLGSKQNDAAQFVRGVMLDIARVARACGYKEIDENFVDTQLQYSIDRGLPGIQPSMLADALDERNLEVEAIIGNVVRMADEKNIPVPILQAVYILIRV